VSSSFLDFFFENSADRCRTGGPRKRRPAVIFPNPTYCCESKMCEARLIVFKEANNWYRGCRHGRTRRISVFLTLRPSYLLIWECQKFPATSSRFVRTLVTLEWGARTLWHICRGKTMPVQWGRGWWEGLKDPSCGVPDSNPRRIKGNSLLMFPQLAHKLR
jgi:hypothetical protein